MSEQLSLPPSSLIIDAQNPRLSEPNVKQRDALRALAKQQGRKLVVLAKDIIEYGLNPSDLPIVEALNDDRSRYIVLEGNRRLSALKALENPDSLVGAIDTASLTQLRKLSKQYHQNPIDTVSCAVVKDRGESDHWIELKHTGENNGAGIVDWLPEDKVRFSARAGKLPRHTQALDFLESEGFITPEQRRKVPSTTFQRILNNRAAREKLGVDYVDGELQIVGVRQQVGKALAYIVDDLASKKTKVAKLYNAKLILDYVNSLPKSLAVKPAKKPSSAATGKGAGQNAKGKTATKRKRPKKRDKLIPSDCILKVADKRVKEIEDELRSLSLEDHTNAVSVLFRVFLELSADAYIDDKKLTAVTEASPLGRKLTEVSSHLVKQTKLTQQQALPVRRACQKDSFLAPSITLMHKYVHCRYLFPGPSDLRSNWDSLQPFVTAMWSP